VDFIKKMTRGKEHALTAKGRAKAGAPAGNRKAARR
jgi:hypothetical protein